MTVTNQSTLSTYLFRILSAFVLSIVSFNSTADERGGIDVYDETCQLCHGPITEPTGWFPSDGTDEIQLAVVTPRGPNLNGIVGRPPAIISNYKYSKGMRKYAETASVWNREMLDLFLTDSRKHVKETFMIMKMDEGDRKLVLDYLENTATYNP